MPGANAPADGCLPPPTRSITGPPISAIRQASAPTSTTSPLRRRWASASPTACSSPPPRRAWAWRWRSRSYSSTTTPRMSMAPVCAAGARCSIVAPRAWAAPWRSWSEAMLMFEIPFGTTDWNGVERTEHPGETGKAYWRTRNFNNIRVRMVEYSPGYLADHWCQKGHVLLVLEGELKTELADAPTVVLKPGQ